MKGYMKKSQTTHGSEQNEDKRIDGLKLVVRF